MIELEVELEDLKIPIKFEFNLTSINSQFD